MFTGKDDKYWAGNYGPLMSAAQVRVRRETKPAEDDAYVDLDMPEVCYPLTLFQTTVF